MSDSESLQPGSTFADRYRVERLIGAGGYARVYRAVQTDLGRQVALKVLRPLKSAEAADSVSERFYREARVLSQLRDEHTITIYDYAQTDGGTLYMVSEYIEGEDLSSALARRGAFGEHAARHVLTQVLKSLREAHANGILHRDIKPSNIMLYEHYGERDRVKLIDFGIAKSLMSGAPGLTMHGTVVGTPRYMSPEQIRGEPLSSASDLFSLGLVLYEMLVGASPFQSRDVRAIYDTIQGFRHSLGPLESKGRGLREVARGLLEPRREDRYETAEAVLADLEDDHGAAGADAATTTVSPSFPLDFDPDGATPTAELTSLGVSIGDATIVDESVRPPQVSARADATIESSTVEVDDAPPRPEPTLEDRVDAGQQTTHQSPVSSNSWLRWLLVLGGAVVLALLIWWVVGASEQPGEATPPAPEPQPAPVVEGPSAVELEAAVGEARGIFVESVDVARVSVREEIEERQKERESRDKERQKERESREKERESREKERESREKERESREKAGEPAGEKRPTFEAFDQMEPQ